MRYSIPLTHKKVTCMNKFLKKTFFIAALIPAISYAVPTPHYIAVSSTNDLKPKWSIQADLYAGDGRKVYHWQENGHKPGSSMHWNYKDGGDKGWLDIFIQPSGIQNYKFLHIPLNKNHCYKLLPSEIGVYFPQVIETQC